MTISYTKYLDEVPKSLYYSRSQIVHERAIKDIDTTGYLHITFGVYINF